MSERRVFVSLTREQAEALIKECKRASSVPWERADDLTRLVSAGASEIYSALAIYDVTQSTVSRLAAVPSLDAASLTEHDASSAEVW